MHRIVTAPEGRTLSGVDPWETGDAVSKAFELYEQTRTTPQIGIKDPQLRGPLRGADAAFRARALRADCRSLCGLIASSATWNLGAAARSNPDASTPAPVDGPLGGHRSRLAAASSQVTTPQVKAELVAHAPEGVAPGKPLWLGLLIQHQPHWHTYWKNPGDSGLPTTLEWQLPPQATAGDIQWPTPRKLPIGPLMNFGYEGTLLLPVPVQVTQPPAGRR
jgi:hypothetical protein